MKSFWSKSFILSRVERTEKICVGSGIGYVSCDQDRVRVGFIRRGWKKSSMFSALFGQHNFQNSSTMKTALIKKMAQLI